jgi:hypothetical protein
MQFRFQRIWTRVLIEVRLEYLARTRNPTFKSLEGVSLAVPNPRALINKRPRWRRLFCHRAERQHDFAEQFVEHLREASVNRGESAEDSLITGDMLESGTRRSEITDGE